MVEAGSKKVEYETNKEEIVVAGPTLIEISIEN
jgi:hypothetical protein